jgi:hypothetical protein
MRDDGQGGVAGLLKVGHWKSAAPSEARSSNGMSSDSRQLGLRPSTRHAMSFREYEIKTLVLDWSSTCCPAESDVMTG